MTPAATKTRPEWLLLRMHYLRILGPLAAIFAGTYLFFFVVFQLISRFSAYGELTQSGELFDYIGICLCGIVALPVGAAVFSRPFKEQHVLFFHALPVPRLRQWAILSGASALALLTALAAVALLRPSTVGTLARDEAGLAAFVILIVLAFTAGLCFSLVFTRTVAVYVFAYVTVLVVPLLSFVVLTAPLFAMGAPYDFGSSMVSRRVVETVLAFYGLPLFPAGMVIALIVATFTISSAVFYVRGETTLPRVQARNLAIVLGASLVVTFFIGPALRAVSPRGTLERYTDTASPDVRFVASGYFYSRRPTAQVVRIFDVARGVQVPDLPLTAVKSIDFVGPDRLALILRDLSPLRRLGYLREANDWLELRGTDGKLLATEVLHGEVQAAKLLDDGRLGIAVRRGPTLHVLARDAAGPARELFSAPAADLVRIEQNVVFLRSDTLPTRAWQIDADRATELPRVPGATKEEQPVVFSGELYPDADILRRRIESTWPVPHAAGDLVAYDISEIVQPWIYATVKRPDAGSASIYVLGAAKQWKIVGETAWPLDRTAFPRYGLILFREVDASRRAWRVHDAASGRSIKAFELPEGDARLVSGYAARLGSPDALAVTVTAGKRGEIARGVAEVLVRDGAFQRLPRRDGRLLARWADGTEIRATGSLIIVARPDGSTKRLEVWR